MEKVSLYIHIPFCKSKCYYCDFLSFTKNTDEEIKKYIDALIKELELYKNHLKDKEIYTIFIGGGTPSSIDSKYIIKIMDYIYNNFNIENLEEVTIEINPGTIDTSKIEDYKKAKINRVSMGLQTTSNKLLKLIGRSHSYETFLESFRIIKDSGFENINIDLISGLPNQSYEDIKTDLDRLIQLKPTHISYYSLILEEGTKMMEIYKDKEELFPDDIEDRKMYHYLVKRLKENSYNHYEISNFAKDGYECRHNIIYWKIHPYIGIGLGAHSNFMNKRYSNKELMSEYIKGIENFKIPIQNEEYIKKDEEISEYCIFGIRLIRGINKGDFLERFKIDIYDIYKDEINKHIKNGLLIDKDGHIFLSDKGLDLANLVEVDFLK